MTSSRASPRMSLLVAVAAVLGLAASCSDSGSTPRAEKDGASPVASGTARVREGRLKGLVGEGTAGFLGVPYAAPPTGELRWAPPAGARLRSAGQRAGSWGTLLG
ncbi:carboxylesterase family protein [Streptomyces varsoviensis]